MKLLIVEDEPHLLSILRKGFAEQNNEVSVALDGKTALEMIYNYNFDVVVLDEINYCCGYNWISGQEIADFILNYKPRWLHLILTGRNAPHEVIEVADTVTEMTKVKHAYEQGILAEQGIEF